MSLFLPNIPQPNDNLDFSQGQLLSNNSGLDTVFGIDHYKFSETSANKGFHDKVTTPGIVAATDPTTDATHAIFYALQKTTPLGLMQYSKAYNGTSSVTTVPTPVTSLQSPSGATTIGIAGTTNLLDFAGIARAIVTVYATDFATADFTTEARLKNSSVVFWNGTAFFIPSQTSSNFLRVQASGSTLQLFNNYGVALNAVYWTLDFARIQ